VDRDAFDILLDAAAAVAHKCTKVVPDVEIAEMINVGENRNRNSTT
jgi:hypothetical protein